MRQAPLIFLGPLVTFTLSRPSDSAPFIYSPRIQNAVTLDMIVLKSEPLATKLAEFRLTSKVRQPDQYTVAPDFQAT